MWPVLHVYPPHAWHKQINWGGGPHHNSCITNLFFLMYACMVADVPPVCVIGPSSRTKMKACWVGVVWAELMATSISYIVPLHSHIKAISVLNTCIATIPYVWWGERWNNLCTLALALNVIHAIKNLGSFGKLEFNRAWLLLDPPHAHVTQAK